MRRSIIVPAALLLFSNLASACAHQSAEPGAVATLDPASDSQSVEASVDAEADEIADADETWIASASPASEHPNVMRFEDEAGPVDVIVAQPKREDIGSFQLFGTGPTASEPGPRLTLPPDAE